MADGAAYLHNILNDGTSIEHESPRVDHDGDSFISGGDDEFSTMSLCSNHPDSISNESGCRPVNGEDTEHLPVPLEIQLENQDFQSREDGLHPNSTNHEIPTNINLPPIPRGKSIAHHHIQEQNVVYCSFDIETGGDKCGILQLSTQLFRINREGEMNTCTEDIFDSYIKPPTGSVIDPKSTVVHGLCMSSLELQNAPVIEVVWGNFCDFISRRIQASEIGILIAYNGESCDLKWLWRLTQAPLSTLSIPSPLKFFMDPLRVIQQYKSCEFHPNNSKLSSLSLKSVYSHITGTQLDGAHNSLNDVKAQSIIVSSCKFVDYINKTKSITTIYEIFSKRAQSEMKKMMEPVLPVHSPWRELKDDDSSSIWSPGRNDQYTGPHGGGVCKPSSKIQTVARKSGRLVDLFLFVFPLSLLEHIATETKRYAYTDWVVQQDRFDRDGAKTSKPFLAPLQPDSSTSIPSNKNARHRADYEGKNILSLHTLSSAGWVFLL